MKKIIMSSFLSISLFSFKTVDSVMYRGKCSFHINSLSAKTTKLVSADFQKNIKPKLCHMRIQRLEGKWANSVDLDEVAHHEPPHQDLRCLQI